MEKGTGIVFDIQRFALYDGPGIRTTVFLKGCPLACIWCHNPESQDPKPQLSLNKEKGISKIIGKERTVDEIMDIVIRDKDYYDNSQGGLTISGGEPLMQMQFTHALLQAAKKHGIHTCIDTSGFAPQKHYQQILDYVDLFLYDYKVTEGDRHRELTGVSNEVILDNLDFLYKNHAKIILRCPLIKGINDSDTHLEGIGNICHRYPDLKGVEIMAYHNMGYSKAIDIGMTPAMAIQPTTNEETKAIWLKKLNKLGCTRVQIG